MKNCARRHTLEEHEPGLAVGDLAAGEQKGDRPTEPVRQGVDLGAAPAAGAADGLMAFPPFTAGCRPMGLHGRGVDQHMSGWTARLGEGLKEIGPNALGGPSDKAVVECLARPIGGRRIDPPRPRLQDVDNATDHPPIVDAGLATRIGRQMRRHLCKLRIRQPEKLSIHPAVRRVRVEVENLKAELPQLGLIVSTRRQALDVPFRGAHLELQPLNENQQLQIATEMRGKVGVELMDHAWRTPGVRELVSIPLYLTALLSLPEGEPFPTTKVEVLWHFVAAHERSAKNAEVLRGVADGLQCKYLDGLAVFATRTANTAIAEGNAQASVSGTATVLLENGLITSRPRPNDILDVLVSNHLLTRARDTGFSFQHQQFQEWYASHTVERRFLAELDDPRTRETLKAEIFDLPVWEESILFAVERLARGEADQIAACGKAILAAFEVDPILAAEMIARATDEVWTQIGATIQATVGAWQAAAKVDRAFRFMLSSGRTDFLPAIWPLITAK